MPLYCNKIHFSPSTFHLSTCCHWAVFAQRDRSPRQGTGPRELSLQSGDFSRSGTGPHLRDRSLGDRSLLRDRFPKGEPSGLSQIWLPLAGVAHGDRPLSQGPVASALPRDPQLRGPVLPLGTGPESEKSAESRFYLFALADSTPKHFLCFGHS
uniref:Uncharacterized protein n=1 Tax=Ananas comosus var. bracteatus TaxID=296719 RepID=A0A6V7QLT4_ANACO|nr:unnamed protein product [Ananas comosus var. bracteatus]